MAWKKLKKKGEDSTDSTHTIACPPMGIFSTARAFHVIIIINEHVTDPLASDGILVSQ